MKSSASLKLTLMMGAAATISGCVEQPDNFASVDECRRSGKPLDLCQSAYDEALAEHIRLAPKYASEAQCRADVDVDQCISTQVPQSDGSFQQVFVPLMAGYLIAANAGPQRQEEGSANASSGGGGGGGYSYNRKVYHGSPVYRSRQYADGYWTADGLKSSKYSSFRHANLTTRTVARSGFGGHASFGGG